jgi:Sec-independent protein translocase protein TatA
MRNIGFGQILVLLLLCFLLFGDFFSLKKKLVEIGKQVNNYILKNNRKKGS